MDLTTIVIWLILPEYNTCFLKVLADIEINDITDIDKVWQLAIIINTFWVMDVANI